MKLIGLSGYARAGKDTVAGILADYGYVRVSFADPMRDMLYALNPIVAREEGGTGAGFIRYAEMIDAIGYEATKGLAEVRELLQRLGTDAGRKVLGENVWVDAAMRGLDPYGLYVVTDVRFPNEFTAVEARFGSMWRVCREGYGPANGHVSENALEGHLHHHYLHNNGDMDALAAAVAALL